MPLVQPKLLPATTDKVVKQTELLRKTCYPLLFSKVQAQGFLQHKQISTFLPAAHPTGHKIMAACSEEVPPASQSQLLTPLTNCHTPLSGSPAPPSPSAPLHLPLPLLAPTDSSCLLSRVSPAIRVCQRLSRLSRLSKPSKSTHTVLAATYGHSLKLIRSLLHLLMSLVRMLSMHHRQARQLSCR